MGIVRAHLPAAPGPLIPVVAVAALLTFAWALLLSSDALVMRLNWDTANYVAKYASGGAGWSDPPWNSHFAMGPVYWLGQWLALPLGGGFIDGARMMNAVSLALAVALVVVTAAQLSGRLWIGALAALAYAFSWGVGILLLTIEDNIVYLPWVTATLCLCVLRIDAWRLRDSVLAGALVALGSLVSWQAGLYLFPALYVAVVLGGGRSLRTRLRDAGTIGLAFVVTMFLWVAFHAATSDLEFGSLSATLLSRPEPSFFPESWRDVRVLLTGPRRIFRHLGTGLMQEIGPVGTESRFVRKLLPQLGLAFFVLLAAGTAVATWVGRRGPRRHLHFVLLVLTVLTVTTSFYVDLPTDKYKRYEYVPLFVSLILATLGGLACGRWPRALTTRAVAVGLMALVLFEGIAGVRWALAYRAQLPERSPPEYFGVKTEPWFVYLRQLRQQTPDRCRYVFRFSQFVHGRYQLEIPAALWDALPAHLVLGQPEDTSEWRHPVNIVQPQDARRQPCDWLAPGVEKLLSDAAPH